MNVEGEEAMGSHIDNDLFLTLEGQMDCVYCTPSKIDFCYLITQDKLFSEETLLDAFRGAMRLEHPEWRELADGNWICPACADRHDLLNKEYEV